MSRNGGVFVEKLPRLPVGVENFEDIRREHFYYVDKTGFIEQLLKEYGKVSLFTRPRRFGKTLNMSMLKAFFEVGTDPALFKGLKILKNEELCEQYMGRFPVVMVSLKNIDAVSYGEAQALTAKMLNREARRFQFLAESTKLTEVDRELYGRLLDPDMDRREIVNGLQELTELLEKHYGRKVIVLIDEYDVPLDKAFQHGYYDEMVSLIRGMLGSVLKTNDSLQMGVLTGCLRITKESIFTGLNNFKVYSVAESAFDEYFGFTDQEVGDMLREYGLEDDSQTVKEWYDGYTFGDENVYCPWDVINYCADHRNDRKMPPQNYWLNTSGNAIVRRFVDMANIQTRNEIEQLIDGKTIIKEIYQELTYNELDSSIDHLWSVLFTTGYLTRKRQIEKNKYELCIPNKEIQELFIRQIQEWFQISSRADQGTLNAFCQAFSDGNVEKIQELFGNYLWNMISVRDSASKEKKENFYHGMLLGLLRFREDWYIKSNAESGAGYSDILIEIPQKRIGIVIEMKYAEQGRFDQACEAALQQIREKRYEEKLIEDGMKRVLAYGIACYRKECEVKIEE